MFALAGIVLFRLCADRLSLNADEGIYLDGALRVMNGQATYRDFFVHTGPGTCWIYAAVFRMLGPSLTHARLPVICENAAIAAAVFFLTANLTSYGFGLAVSFIAFAFLTRDIGMIGIVALSIALWMAADREIRKLLPAFLLGITAVSILRIGILVAKQALGPVIHHLLWTGANYSRANHVPYVWKSVPAWVPWVGFSMRCS